MREIHNRGNDAKNQVQNVIAAFLRHVCVSTENHIYLPMTKYVVLGIFLCINSIFHCQFQESSERQFSNFLLNISGRFEFHAQVPTQNSCDQSR